MLELIQEERLLRDREKDAAFERAEEAEQAAAHRRASLSDSDRAAADAMEREERKTQVKAALLGYSSKKLESDKLVRDLLYCIDMGYPAYADKILEASIALDEGLAVAVIGPLVTRLTVGVRGFETYASGAALKKRLTRSVAQFHYLRMEGTEAAIDQRKVPVACKIVYVQ